MVDSGFSSTAGHPHMRYRIIGTHAKQEGTIEEVVEAASESQARAIAAKRGIAVRSVEPAPEPSPASSTQPRISSDDPEKPVLVRIEPGYVQTIERTGKRWKGLMLIGALALIGGTTSCGWLVVRDPRALSDPPMLAWVGGAIALVGLLVLLVGRIGAWWHHG